MYPYLFLFIGTAAVACALISILMEKEPCQEEKRRGKRRNSTSRSIRLCHYCNYNVLTSDSVICHTCYERNRKIQKSDTTQSHKRNRKIQESQTTQSQAKCRTCKVKPAVKCDPCGHIIMCQDCIKCYKETDDKCPECRTILK